MATTAVKEGDHWVLNGNKLWITNGGIADFFTVFAKTPEEGGRGKMTAFIVTKDMEGVSIGPHEDKMGLRSSSTTTVHLDNVKVPDNNVLGEPGQGFKVAMMILNSGRTGLGGGSVGAMKHLIGMATKQANERKTFGEPISSYGLIKKKVARMVIDCYTSEAAVTMVGGLIDDGYKDYQVEAAISKVYATECLWRTADEALQIAGGNGYHARVPLRAHRTRLPHQPHLRGDERDSALAHRSDRDERRREPAPRDLGNHEGHLQRADQGFRSPLRLRA